LLEGERGAGQTCVATGTLRVAIRRLLLLLSPPPLATHTHTAVDDSCKGGKVI